MLSVSAVLGAVFGEMFGVRRVWPGVVFALPQANAPVAKPTRSAYLVFIL
jgi:hypothetical protein